MTAPAADSIGHGKLTALVSARPDRGTQRALRAALDDAKAYLAATRLHADSSRIQYAATGLRPRRHRPRPALGDHQRLPDRGRARRAHLRHRGLQQVKERTRPQ